MTARITQRHLASLWLLILIIGVWGLIYRGALNPDETFENLIVGIHDNGYENSTIMYVKDGLVEVQTAITKTDIVFRPRGNHIKRFRVGSLAPVTFDCGQKPGESCDLSNPHILKMYASSVLVSIVKIN